jgi:hypothetical protein
MIGKLFYVTLFHIKRQKQHIHITKRHLIMNDSSFRKNFLQLISTKIYLNDVKKR